MDVTSAIQSLGSDYVSKISDAMKSTATSNYNTNATSSDTFDSIYNSAIGMLNDTNTYIQQAQQAQVDFALGNITSTHELGAIQQKANTALQFTVAVRDKVLEAYKEIMNMNI